MTSVTDVHKSRHVFWDQSVPDYEFIVTEITTSDVGLTLRALVF